MEGWNTNADPDQHGVGYLLHGLPDHIVDGYFTAVQELDDRIEIRKTSAASTATHMR
ncbi:hypothetical protein [Streptomyces sp. NPDC002221]|uniref:hypothetical protein n=1 Tax=Streptomyces sp. NPDC002221 TaxID=3364639 RepID=UPI0036CA3C55